MTRIHSFVSGAIVLSAVGLLSVNAGAKEFGSPGTVEVGGSVGISSGNEKQSASGASQTTNSTSVSLLPFIGYFVSDGLEIGGTLDFGIDNTKTGSVKDDETTVGLGAKGAYYFKAGTSGARIGPALTIEYLSMHASIDNGTGSTASGTNSGPGFAPGVDLKVPIGNAGVLTAGVDYLIYSGTITQSGSPNIDDKVNELNVNAGFSIYF